MNVYIYRYGSIIYVTLGSHILIFVWLNIYVCIYIYTGFYAKNNHSNSPQYDSFILAAPYGYLSLWGAGRHWSFLQVQEGISEGGTGAPAKHVFFFFEKKHGDFYMSFFIWELNTLVRWSRFFWSTWGKLLFENYSFFWGWGIDLYTCVIWCKLLCHHPGYQSKMKGKGIFFIPVL